MSERKTVMKKEVVCDVCGRVYLEIRRRHYCEHCKKYYYLCSDCRISHAKCRLCGIPLKKKGEPDQVHQH